MNRSLSIALAAILVVATVAVPVAAASVVSSATVQDDPESNAETDSIKPGARFAAAVGVQHAELEGDVSTRAIDIRLANAETNATKASLIADHLETSERRLADLEARLERLNESREAGELSEGRYRAEVAQTAAEMRTIERQTAIAASTAADLPADVRDERGIDIESIRTLRDRAADLGGPDTVSIARSIAGDDVGRSIGDGREPRGPQRSAIESPGGQNGTAAPPNEN